MISLKRQVKNQVKNFLGFLYYYGFHKFIKVGNRCLIYHAFGAELKHDTYGISININRFKDHLKYLQDNYRLTEFNDFTHNDISVSLSIDDGYKDTLDAIDNLNTNNIPFSLFITTDNINKHGYLTEKDLVDISKLTNSTIGSHGLSHTKLGSIPYDSQLREIRESKEILQKITSKKINSMSFPHGSYNNDTLNILTKLKYEFAACSKKGFNISETNKFQLNRSEIIASDKIIDLKRKIIGFYDYY